MTVRENSKLEMPHSSVIGGRLFKVRVRDKNIARTPYAYAVGNEICQLSTPRCLTVLYHWR
ncbi:hypothetical protein DQJ29_21935 [Salmonella enterica subsp. enterica]|nr:hypothetical protein [Salmonella enterica subsp. enterica serovar Typhimurium]